MRCLTVMNRTSEAPTHHSCLVCVCHCWLAPFTLPCRLTQFSEWIFMTRGLTGLIGVLSQMNYESQVWIHVHIIYQRPWEGGAKVICNSEVYVVLSEISFNTKINRVPTPPLLGVRLHTPSPIQNHHSSFHTVCSTFKLCVYKLTNTILKNVLVKTIR